jgi:hypothetical protein
LEGWVEPRLTDLGGLTELTQSIDLFFGPSQSGVHDLSFSGVDTSGAGAGGTGTPAHAATGTTPASSGVPPAGGTGPAGSGIPAGTGATGAAHGQLPFTGYSATGIAAIGAALSAAGVAIRRALSSSRQR